MKESPILKKIQIECVDAVTRLFRNNVGKAWQGKHSFLQDGSMILQHPRRIHFGLCKDSSDLVGFKSITITPDMVGQKVAVFAALEIKSDDGVATSGQTLFTNMVTDMGGLSGVARSVDEANWILKR